MIRLLLVRIRLCRVGWNPPGTGLVSLNIDGACVDGRESGVEEL